MKIDRKKNLRSSEWEPGSDIPDTNQSGPEDIETTIFGICSSEIHNEFLNSFTQTYSKNKQHSILLQLLQQRYRNQGEMPVRGAPVEGL
ncbi:hypothetical protein O181_021605 [Austropuccinia psidii MF-1]|uniref:Uncharacterized protein n=1 Tax=Austropuccinia psidii MF-1 TaxID=1389203 RepID=A0A9Q3CG02_9BASI|nr:hypothetical protein [Austropuccinia psidii MF-1]